MKYDLSASRIGTFMSCPAMYYFRYIDGIRSLPTPPLARGKAVHAGAELHGRRRIEARTNPSIIPSLEEVLDFVSETFDKESELTDFGEDDPGFFKDQCIALAKSFVETVAPTFEPAMVEQTLYFSIMTPIGPVRLIAILDNIDLDGNIRDLKCYAKTPTQSDVQKNVQLSIYSMAYRSEMAMEEASVNLDVLVTKKEIEAITLSSKRNQQDLDICAKTIAGVWMQIQAGNFYPNVDTYRCSPKMCPYFYHCQSGTQRCL